MDYEHAMCNQGYCPGRRRTQAASKEKEEEKKMHDKAIKVQKEEVQQKEEDDGVKVLLIDMSQSYDIMEEAEALTGDKGMWMHEKKKWQKPKITKLVPEYRSYDYHKPGHTKLKPIHRVYQQPPSPALLVVVPEKHPWFKHPWLNKFSKDKSYRKRKLRTRRRRSRKAGKAPRKGSNEKGGYNTKPKKGFRTKPVAPKAPKVGDSSKS